jgi:hypothetical protein
VLLKDTHQILREIAEFFAGEDERALKARKKLEKKDKESGAFYANILVDLQGLGETLDGIPDILADEKGAGTRAVCHLLQTIQDKYLKAEDESDDEDSSSSKVSHCHLMVWASDEACNRTRNNLHH